MARSRSVKGSAHLKAHFEEIDGGLREVVAIVEILQRPLFDSSFTQQFANTFSAHALDLVRRNLHRSAVVNIGRLWDENDDARSIPNLWHTVSSNGGREEFFQRRRTTALEFPPRRDGHVALTERTARADKFEREARRELEQLRILIDDPDAAKTRQSLLILRDKIAHAVEQTRREKRLTKSGISVEKTKWGDLNRVTQHSMKVSIALASVTQDLSASYEDSQTIWADYANHFWASFTNPT